MLRFAAILVLASACACTPSSHAGARESVIPTPPVFEDDERASQIYVRAIWIAWTGAEAAASTIARTREEARERADMVAGVAQMAGESFPELVAKYSDRPALGAGGGGAGAELVAGNGILPPAAEAAAFRLAIGEVSPPVDTPQGFVIVMRTEAPSATSPTVAAEEGEEPAGRGQEEPGLGEEED